MRSDLIDELLREHFSVEVGVMISVASAADYAALPHRPEKRLGIYGPLAYPPPPAERQPDQPPYMMVWSPEYLDTLTDDLDDEDFDHYIGVATYIADMMIALGREIPDLHERFRSIEDVVVEQFPGSAELLNLVELRALDANGGPGV